MSEVAQCPCTLVVQFPAEVYRSTGESVVLPELLKSVDVPKVRCVQFIRNGLVRVTFTDAASCDAALSSGVAFRGDRLPVSPVSARSRLVYLRDLPAEVPVPFVKAALSSYGTVHDVTAMEHSGYPGLLNGTRLVKVTLENDIPSTVHIRGFDCRVWYQGQPQACAVCRSYRHRVRECPLNGLCRRCHQAGHVARECREPRRRPSTVHHESLSVLVDSSEVVDSNDEANEVEFASCDESDDRSSISEGEEVLASGDESVLAEGSVVLPPRRSTPVSTSASTVSAPLVSSAPKRPLSPSVTSSPVSKVKTSPVVQSPVVPSPSDVKSSNVSSADLSSVPDVKSSPPAATGVLKVKPTPPSATGAAKAHVKPSILPSDKPPSVPKVTASRPKTPAARAPTVWIPKSISSYATVFKDSESPYGVSRFDFGSFQRKIIRDTTSFEYDRFVSYVHHYCARPDFTDFSNIVPASNLPRLGPGELKKFPAQID